MLVPVMAYAERGWACAEDGRIQKYKRSGGRLITEGSALDEWLRSTNKALGHPEDELLLTWKIIVDNDIGLVALQSEAGKSTQNGYRTTERDGIAYAYADLLVINKISGSLRHMSSNVSSRNPHSEVKEGNCVVY